MCHIGTQYLGFFEELLSYFPRPLHCFMFLPVTYEVQFLHVFPNPSYSVTLVIIILVAVKWLLMYFHVHSCDH
jgi:hypothetical protein